MNKPYLLMKKTLVFSLATHGYDIIWDRCIASHERYAKKHTYEYFCIKDIPSWHTHNQVVRTKLAAIEHALSYYERVIFLDSDCMINENCPPFESLEQEGKYMYFSQGFSGRINSWVIICRSHEETKKLLRTIVDNKDKEIPAQDHVAWAYGISENGHVIHYCHDHPIVHIIDRKRNNNKELSMKDYIRHFSWGPMRKSYKLSRAWKLQSRKIATKNITKKIVKKLGYTAPQKPTKSFEKLMEYLFAHYPLLSWKKN